MNRLLLSLAVLLSAAASAGEVVFYRCTDGGGALTLQNMPCPAGSREEKRTLQAVNTVPMRPVPAAGVVAPPAAVPRADTATANDPPADAAPAPLAPLSAGEAPIAPAAQAPLERLPPPQLFQCTTHERHTYITEDSAPQSRCVPLRTVGLDGNPATGAGQACEVRRDICARVPDQTLCQAWTRRLGEVQVAARFGRADNAADNEAELARVRRILAESTCSK